MVHSTINSIYPNYYPAEVVTFFLEYHNEDTIRADIERGNVFLLSDDGKYVGTGGIDDKYIGRVYVLPEYQGRGYGSFIMNELEAKIKESFDFAFLDASMPSYSFYLKRGYQPTEYLKYEVENHRILCYYVMEKAL